MGAFDTVPNIAIPDDEANPVEAEAFRKKWKWDAHEIIMVKGAYSQADQEAVANAGATAGKKGKVQMQFGSGRTKLLELMIAEWTLTHKGQPVPVSLGAIRRLPANYTTPVLEVCDVLAMAMTEDEQEDFLDSALEPTKANLQTVK